MNDLLGIMSQALFVISVILTHPLSNLSHEDDVHIRMGAQVVRQYVSLSGQAELIQHQAAAIFTTSLSINSVSPQ